MRKYYSVRTGKNPNTQFTLKYLLDLFAILFDEFWGKGYFQEYFGYNCVDQGYVDGIIGPNVDGYFYRHLRKNNLWPIDNLYSSYSEDDLFDVIEFLYDHISKPIPTGNDYHSYADCGYHYKKFDKKAGQSDYRKEINSLLSEYKGGFELSEQGEILILGEKGLNLLLEAPIPSFDPNNIDNKVALAVQKYRRARATVDERKDAIRELADVLEFLRNEAKQYLEDQDEKDIFNIANNFGIRHHNPNQKTKYENAIWYSWIFYYYLATIHALIRLVDKSKKKEKGITN